MKPSRINWTGDLFGSEEDKLANLKWIWTITVATFFYGLSSGCMCGHLDQIALIGTTIGLVSSWSFIYTGSRKNLTTRIAAWLGVAIVSIIFLKNVCDVLWFGHFPIFTKLG